MNNPRRIQRHLVKALAAGAVLVAAALPLAISGVASAATAPTLTSVTFTPGGLNYFGQGASGTVAIVGANFAADGGNVTITSTAPGLTFSDVAETSSSAATADFASTSATVPGTYSVTYTDDNGSVTDTALITVNADPSFTSVSPNSIVDPASAAETELTVTGGGFETGDMVTLTNAANGTTLASQAVGDTFTSGKAASGDQGTTTFGSASSVTLDVEPTNSVTGLPASIGEYTVTVTNPDGGSVVSGQVFSVAGNEISEVSPSAVAAVATSTPITITGSGFDSGATLSLESACTTAGVSLGTPTITTSTITDTLTVSTGAAAAYTTTPGQCDLTVDNGASGNGATYESLGAIGIGEASAVAPTITASSLSAAAAIEPGAGAQSITFTGTGFSQYTSPVETTIGTTGDPDNYASIGTTDASCLDGQSGTTLLCELSVTGATASTAATTGVHGAELENSSATTTFPGAFTVAGPTITSAAPTALSVGAPVGTVVALTGTGFGPTTTGTSVGVTGVFQNVSATQEDFVVTASPVTGTTSTTITVTAVDSDSAYSTSAAFTLPVESAPSVTSTTYVTGTTGVGIGAKAQTVTITGSGFATGATIGKFVNAAGVADPDVTGTVTSVNAAGTVITATIAIAAGDTNTIDGYTVTNTNGGTTLAAAAAPAGLVIDAAPTLTSVSPTTATASSTNAFTITGTDFETGATVVLSSDGTCGTATVASTTSITVSCTIGAPTTSAVTLSVVNPDGGTATSGTILAAVKAATFHVTGAHGTAIAGKTVTMTISGTGFYGQPKITSTAAGSKIGVSKDTGKLLTIRVTTKAGISGEHTFTITLANGKSAKANYAIKK